MENRNPLPFVAATVASLQGGFGQGRVGVIAPSRPALLTSSRSILGPLLLVYSLNTMYALYIIACLLSSTFERGRARHKVPQREQGKAWVKDPPQQERKEKGTMHRAPYTKSRRRARTGKSENRLRS